MCTQCPIMPFPAPSPPHPHQGLGPYREASGACVEVRVAERADDDSADNALQGPQGAFR